MKFSLALACALMVGITMNANAQEDTVPAALDFTMKSIDGKDVELKDFQGKVVLVVNVASKCGLTPQYEGLQSLYEQHQEDGLVVLGFPCDQFRNQEFATNIEIKEFCTKEYGVDFPMFAKVNVNGDDRCGLYEFLTGVETKPQNKGDINWNFEKFLIGRNGEVIGRYHPRVKPDNEDLMAAIKSELDKEDGE